MVDWEAKAGESESGMGGAGERMLFLALAGTDAGGRPGYRY